MEQSRQVDEEYKRRDNKKLGEALKLLKRSTAETTDPNKHPLPVTGPLKHT
jgi:hypothetical protein